MRKRSKRESPARRKSKPEGKSAEQKRTAAAKGKSKSPAGEPEGKRKPQGGGKAKAAPAGQGKAKRKRPAAGSQGQEAKTKRKAKAKAKRAASSGKGTAPVRGEAGAQGPIADPYRMSGAGVARLFGVSWQAVRKWLDYGCPRNGDGTFSLPAVIQWRLDRAEGAESRSSEHCPHTIRWRAARADLKEIDLAERRGQLVSAAAVEAKWGRLLTVLKQRLLGLPPALAPRVALSDSARAAALLDEGIREVLVDIAEQYEGGG